jgi:two-component system LytT family response regulator
MNITAILIDDEPKASAILKNKLERFCSNVVVIGETQNPHEGLALIEKLKPQLVFLDVAMPEMSGFDLLAKIPNPAFEIIFVTAFDSYAVDALNHCAIGYLVKPVDNQALLATALKAIKNIEAKTALAKNKLLIENLGAQSFHDKKMVIPSQDGLEFVKIASIIHCEGTEGYTKIHFVDRKPILSSNSIGHFNKLLKNSDFFLVHKSHLINLDHIKKYLNEGTLILSDNSSVPVSRNRRVDFLKTFKNN